MRQKIADLIPKVNLTGIGVTLVEKLHIVGKQTSEVDISELQSAIERQSRPVIRSRAKEIESKKYSGTYLDFLTIDLENNGEGVAKNLIVRPTLKVGHGPDLEDMMHVDVETSGFLSGDGLEISPAYFPLTRVDTEENTTRGGVIHPDDGIVSFSGQIEFREVTHKKDGGTEWTHFTIDEVTDRLSSLGFHDLSFQVHVLYMDINDSIFAEQVLGKAGEFEGGMNLEDISNLKVSTESSTNDQVLKKVQNSIKYPP